ncbi:MAG: fatty acid CoA ligase family protein, partial [Myxococcota bacterium]|nr:fatty acid CoA ligase family protein [Myxococcota bacterium]
MVSPGLDLFAVTFALFKVGAVPVMVDPGIGLANMKTCLAESEPEAFIGVTRAQLARVLLGWARSTLRTIVSVGPWLPWAGPGLEQVRADGASDEPYPMAPTAAEELAAILFTSGSTGVPKGVMYRHGNFMAQVQAIRAVYDIRPGEVDLPTFPLFGLFDPALGMTTVIPDMDPTRPARVDPRRVLPAMETFGVTNMFGSPALLDTLGRYGEKHGTRIPTLKRVISAGAPVPLDVMERFLGMCGEGARVVTPYGATESLPVCSVGSDELLVDPQLRRRTETGEGVCVGRPLPEVELDVIAITDDVVATWSEVQPVPQGQTGEIVVRSAMTTTGYHNRERSTALAKIQGPDGGIAHRMGDLGHLDEDGRLWFC